MKKIIVIIAVFFLVLMISLFFLGEFGKSKNAPGENSQAPAEKTETTVSEPVVSEPVVTEPEEEPMVFTIQGNNLQGEAVGNELLQGKTLTLINVWGTFCGPCVEEVPDLASLHKELLGENGQVVGIIADTSTEFHENIDTAIKILDDSGADYPNVVPGPEMFDTLATIAVVPTSFFVDENGKQVGESIRGSRSKEEYKKLFEEALAQLP